MKSRLLPFLTLVVAVSWVLMSCADQNRTRDFAERFAAAEEKAWKTGDTADLAALESTDVIYHLPGLDLKGWEAHQDYILQSRPNISAQEQNWQYLSGEGNHFALTYDSTATVTETDGSSSAVTANYLFFFKLQDGRVAEVWANGSMTTNPVEESAAAY